MSDHYFCKRCGQRYDECACVSTFKVVPPKYVLTDWFPVKIKPVRDGWYLAKYSDSENMLYYCNGWWFWEDTGEEEDEAKFPISWRGILK